MLRYGYTAPGQRRDRRLGHAGADHPASLVLIVLADQLGKSVGDMYKGAFIPGFTLMGLYILFVFALAIFKPKMVPALPPEARTFREPSGRSGYLSLALLALLSTAVAVLLGKNMAAIHTWWQGELVESCRPTRRSSSPCAAAASSPG
jgi:GntP family gluconate:H+ symporter